MLPEENQFNNCQEGEIFLYFIQPSERLLFPAKPAAVPSGL